MASAPVHAVKNAAPSPYSIAFGAVAYALATTFHKHLSVEAIAAAPAAVSVVVAAIERGFDFVDPKAASEVDRLAAQAKAAAAQVVAEASTMSTSA